MSSATPPGLTRNQSLVFEALARADAPMTAYAILDLLRDAGMRAPLQVYRALDKLRAQGLVHRLESLNAFVACTHGEHPQAASAVPTLFVICEACGHVVEFQDAALTRRLRRLADEQSFTIRESTLELRGRCSACQMSSA